MRIKSMLEILNQAHMTTDYVEWFRDSRPVGSLIMVDRKLMRVAESYPSFCKLNDGSTRTWLELAGQYFRETVE